MSTLAAPTNYEVISDLLLPNVVCDLFVQIDEECEEVSTLREMISLRERIIELCLVVMKFHPMHSMILDLTALLSVLLNKIKLIKED